MIEEYIYEENGQFIIKKEIRGKLVNFGTFDNLEDAIEERDELEDYGWPYLDESDNIEEVEKFIFKEDGRYYISKRILDYDIVFGNFDSVEGAKKLKHKLIDNGWNVNFQSRPPKYGKFIQKTAGNKYTIVKDIDGTNKRFGTYKRLDEALTIRDELISDNWKMGPYSILSNLGITEIDSNTGKVGRKVAVYKWEDSKLILYGIYRSLRLANKVINKLVLSKKNNLSYLDKCREKDTRFIYRVGEYYRVSKSFNGELKNFGHYKSLNEAISIRDQLIKNNWDDSFLGLKRVTRSSNSYNKNIHKTSRGYEVVKRIDGELMSFGLFESLEDAISYRDELEETGWVIESPYDDEISEEKYDEFIYIKNDSKYYLKNEINGETRIFGVFDNPLDAIAARLDCMKNNWDSFSVLEEDYEKNHSSNLSFGLLKDDDLLEEDVGVFSDKLSDTIDFPVTVGKSYKNRGWAVKREHLERFVPKLPYEEDCVILVNGRPISGKINIHTRLFYFMDERLSAYLEKLYEIDPKIQTRIDLKLEHGVYEFNPEIENNNIFFITKFSKSFRKGLFAIPRSASEMILPRLPYESECTFIINDMEVRGKFNLEFRFKFSDEETISSLNSELEDGDELEVILLL